MTLVIFKAFHCFWKVFLLYICTMYMCKGRRPCKNMIRENDDLRNISTEPISRRAHRLLEFRKCVLTFWQFSPGFGSLNLWQFGQLKLKWAAIQLYYQIKQEKYDRIFIMWFDNSKELFDVHYSVSQYQLYFFKSMLRAQKSSDFKNSFTRWSLKLWLLSLEHEKL